MAAVHSRSRHGSSSDPFSDPVYPQSQQPRQSTRNNLPPPPPPKSAKMSAPRPHRDNIIEAVRDTVHVRSSENSPRTRMGRSQTTVQANPPTPTRPSPVGRRSQSQDSVLQAAAALEKAKISGKPRSAKKGSMHADVIDRLDFTGVGPMFHHDGPFDACAPSRNRHRTKAPMLAWSGHPSDEPTGYNTDSPYPSADVFKNAFSSSYDPPKKKVDAIAEAWGIHEPEPFEDFSAGGGSSRPDGDTPTSSVYNGKDNGGSRNGTLHASGRRGKDGRDPREVYREYLEEGQQPRKTKKRTPLPPPQPIFIGDSQLENPDIAASMPSPTSNSPGAPKRTRSLMHRIRQMRDSPNVPVGAGYEENGDPSPPSPSSIEYPYSAPGARPTHRPQNSFLGRLAGKKDSISPTSDTSDNFVYVDDVNPKTKDLPATPGSARTPSIDNSSKGYFDESATYGALTSPGGGIGRKTSLMRKVRGVVKGNK